MKKIGDITNTADKNGEFTDGNVAAGTPPTQLMGAWFNSVQREILNVLAKAGIPQSATKEDQLAEAITEMVASAGYLPTGYSYSKSESDGRYQPKGDYATNTALNNGLGLKLDKTGGTVIGKITVKRNGDGINLTPATDGSAFYIQLDEFDGKRAGYLGFGSSSGAAANILTIRNDRANTQFQITDNAALINGTRLLFAGESGIGSKAEQITNPLLDLPNKQSGFYLTAAGATGAPTAEYYNYWWISRGSTTYGTVIAVGRRGDIWTNSLSGGAWLGWIASYTTDNTTKDTNGFIRTGSATALTTGQVMQSSGASISNIMSQKAVTDVAFGIEQRWRDVTAERIKGTTYTNSRNKAIMISVQGSTTSPSIAVNGSIVKKSSEMHDYGVAVIPAGATYVVNMEGSVLHWSELA